jgi:predicted transposase YbfD/YdcC
MSPSFIEHFAKLKDPRIERSKLHELMDILVLVVCAQIAGANGWEAIATFGRSKIEWLRQFVPLKNGIPSPDCIAYVISRISPKNFQECFIAWVKDVSQQTQGSIVSIDGKTARGSRDRKNNKNPLHMVSAWAAANHMVLGQEVTNEKSNEITAIPKLLELLELHGCIVTIDAMGCQTEIAAQIIDQGADYVLGLKGNQGTMHEAVKDYFVTAEANEFKDVQCDYVEEIDGDHGRIETRRYWITEDLNTLPQKNQWKGLKSIGMVERICEVNGKVTVERRFFLCSIPANAKLFAKAVRGHWGIENRLHWRMDVVFKEDASRIRKGFAPAIMTSIRHLCINLFEKAGSKLSLNKQRYMATLDDNFRAKVLMA